MPRSTSQLIGRLISGLVVAALVLTSCTGDDGSSGASSTATIDTSSTTCETEQVSMGEEGVAIERIISDTASANGLASVVYRVTRGDELIASGALGDSMYGIPVEQNMHVRTGNVAFAYMGTLLLLMAEEGEVSLDDPLSKWLPDVDVPDADQVTLQMLTRSTSGYPDYVPNEDFQNTFLTDPFGEITPEQLLRFAFETPPWYPPGTAWNYAHTNYVLLGMALAEAGGKPLDQLLVERVIEPLGLQSTVPVLSPEMPSPVLHTYTHERGPLEETTYWNPSWQTAPGGVVASNICDLVVSARGIGRGELLDDASREQFLAPVTAELDPAPASCPPSACRQLNEDFYYALGVIVGGGWIMQTPNFGGLGAVHAYLPEEDLAVAIVAIAGAGGEPGTNYAQEMLGQIAAELTPDHTLSRPGG